MRMPLWVATVSVIDGVVFICTYVLEHLTHSHTVQLVFGALYWFTVWAGLVLAVYGFVALTRGGESELRKSVICILFAMIPACIGLYTVLSHLGTPVGHVGA